MIAWSDPLTFLHGLTAQQRRALKSLEVQTVGELLSVFPRRYDDYTRLMPIAKIPNGVPVTIKATVKEIKQAPTFRKRFALIRAVVSDDSGSIGVTWFNQPWLLKQLKAGDEIYISGAVTQRPRFGRGFTSPLWEPANAETLAAGNVAPVYPLAGSLAQKTIRKAVRAAVEEVAYPEDPLPSELLSSFHLLPIADAYRSLHRPATMEEAERARQRFAFQEVLVYQLALRMARNESNEAGAPIFSFDEPFAKKFASSFPFELTDDQKKAVWACVKDMETSRPMRRMLQGDVGSGKTAVAAMLAALVFRSGGSAALMAPTEILAKQHAETLRRFLVTHGIPVLLATSSTRMLFEGTESTKLSADESRERIAQGRIVLVGTQALLVHGHGPPDLVLAIVDEQHRFGVAQREALTVMARADSKVPHLLSMSATPIPRSLALTFLGDLEVSVIRTKPAGRLPVETHVLSGEQGRTVACERIRKEVADGNRAFVVCPLIDPSDVLGVKSVEAEARRLSSGPLIGLRIGVLHGKLPKKEKDEVMGKFAAGELDVLVATTVVEVGVDVPEATVIVIDGAERFGLAQLHQLRGRVGRSSRPSVCFLIGSDDVEPFGLNRLRILERTNDGFAVAEEDLRIRGEGNLLGTQQSGVPMFTMARMDDLALMTNAREASEELVSGDPEMEKHPLLRELVLKMRETSHRE
ncbi:MAG: ATP-dependent DNA helicase RecG [Patescibacteria group bacterium]